MRIIISVSLLFVISNTTYSQRLDICFIQTRGMAKSKGLNVNLPYLCSWTLTTNRSPDCVLAFNTEKTLVSEWLLVQQVQQQMEGFNNIDKINEIKKSFTSETDKVVSVKNVNLGKIKSWEVILDKYGTYKGDSTYDRCVDYFFQYKTYWVSIIFTCTDRIQDKSLTIEKFKTHYLMFKAIAMKVNIVPY